ncbi:uncharacterized protein BDW43DRAFT_260654 [Aspergillus alliaceus]|uniref:uncharacterized protein n=1 Tax=Petromyces alliaceus TaxID=209559 RepID=UPI0012A4BCEB|nr:uncharacterized protein BDW43DRAFT_260654 [Aspergillus alliaceus]KAB8239147.1 hypothetical protein BDW43DRAFT_260654 [Aspergillus alliaceus]
MFWKSLRAPVGPDLIFRTSTEIPRGKEAVLFTINGDIKALQDLFVPGQIFFLIELKVGTYHSV